MMMMIIIIILIIVVVIIISDVMILIQATCVTAWRFTWLRGRSSTWAPNASRASTSACADTLWMVIALDLASVNGATGNRTVRTGLYMIDKGALPVEELPVSVNEL